MVYPCCSFSRPDLRRLQSWPYRTCVMGVFPPIAYEEWRQRIWQDVVNISADSKSKLFPGGVPLFPLGTPACEIADVLPFPPEHLPMCLCIFDAKLQQGVPLCLVPSAANSSALQNPCPPTRLPSCWVQEELGHGDARWSGRARSVHQRGRDIHHRRAEGTHREGSRILVPDRHARRLSNI